MTGMLLYLALGLMILTVLSNRFWRRQLTTVSVSLAKLKETSDEIGVEVADTAQEYAALDAQYNEALKRTTKLEQEVEAAVAELEVKKAAAVNRYYVFDRQEPRPGRFFEAVVRYDPTAAPDERPVHRAWIGVRRYVLLAETEREARDMLSARFPRKHGFEVIEVAACRLAGLSINRIAELSTFRRPTAGDGEDEAKRPARRAVPSKA